MAIPFNRIAPLSGGYRPDPRREPPASGDRRRGPRMPVREEAQTSSGPADEREAPAERDASPTPGAPFRTRPAEFWAQEAHVRQHFLANRYPQPHRGPDDPEVAVEVRSPNLDKTPKKKGRRSAKGRAEGADAQPARFQALGASPHTPAARVRAQEAHMRRLLGASLRNSVGSAVTVVQDGHAVLHGATVDGPAPAEAAPPQPVSAPEALRRLGQLDAEGHAVAGSYAHTLQLLAASEDDAGWNEFFSTVYPEYDPAQRPKGEDPAATLRARLAKGDFSLLPDVLFARADEPGLDLQGRDGVFFAGDPDNEDPRLRRPLVILNAAAPQAVQQRVFSHELGHGLERWFLPEGVEDSRGDEGARLGVALRGLTVFHKKERGVSAGAHGAGVNAALNAPAPRSGGQTRLRAAIEQAGQVKDAGQARLFGQLHAVETDTASGAGAPDRLATTEEVAHLFGGSVHYENTLGAGLRYQRTIAERDRGTLFTPSFAARPGTRSTPEQMAAVEAAYRAIENLFYDPATGKHRPPKAKDVKAFLDGPGSNVRFVVTSDLPTLDTDHSENLSGVGPAPLWSQQDTDDPSVLNIYVHTSVLGSTDPLIRTALAHQIGEYLHFAQAGPEAYAREQRAYSFGIGGTVQDDLAYGEVFWRSFLNPEIEGEFSVFNTGKFGPEWGADQPTPLFHHLRYATSDLGGFRGQPASLGFSFGRVYGEHGGQHRLPPRPPDTGIGQAVYDQLLAGSTHPLFLGQRSLSAVAEAVDALPEYYGELLLDVLRETPNALDGILGESGPKSLRVRLNRRKLSIEEGAQLILGALTNLTRGASLEAQAAALHRLALGAFEGAGVSYAGEALLSTSYIVNRFLPAGRDFDVTAWAGGDLEKPQDPALRDALHKSYLVLAQQHPKFDINDENWLSTLHTAARSDLWLTHTEHPITDKHREFHFIFDEGVRTALSVARWVLDPDAGPGLKVSFTKPDGDTKVLTAEDFDNAEFLDNPLLVAAAGLEVLAAYKAWELNAPNRYDENGNLARTPLEIIMGREAASNAWVLNKDSGQFIGTEISTRDAWKSIPSLVDVAQKGPLAAILGLFGVGTGAPKQVFGAIVDSIFGGKPAFEFKRKDTTEKNDAQVAGSFAQNVLNVEQDIAALLPQLGENIETAYSQLPDLIENGSYEDEVKIGLLIATSVLGLVPGPLGIVADAVEFAGALGFASIDRARRDSLFNSMLKPMRAAGRDTHWIDRNKQQSHQKFIDNVGEAGAWFAADLASPAIADAVVSAVKATRKAVKSAKHVASSPAVLNKLAASAGTVAEQADEAKVLGRAANPADGASAVKPAGSRLDEAAALAEAQGLGKRTILERADDAADSIRDLNKAGAGKAKKGPVARKLAELREGATGQAKEILRKINPKTEEGLDTAANVLGAVAVRATFEGIEFVLYDDTSISVPWDKLDDFLSAVRDLNTYIEAVQSMASTVKDGSAAVKDLFTGGLDGILNAVGKTLPPGIDPWAGLLFMAQQAASLSGDTEGAQFLEKALANVGPTEFDSTPITADQFGELLGHQVAGPDDRPIALTDWILSLPAGQMDDVVQGLLAALPEEDQPADLQADPVEARWSSVLQAVETGDLSHLEEAGLHIERVAETSNPPAYFAPMGADGEVDYSDKGTPTIFLAANASGADLLEELFEWLAFEAMGPEAAKQLVYGPYDDQGVPDREMPDIDFDAGKAIAFAAEALARGASLDEDLFTTALALPVVQASDRVPFFGGFATGAVNPIKVLGRANKLFGSTRKKGVAGAAAGLTLGAIGASQIANHAAVAYKAEGFGILVTGFNPQFADTFHDPGTGLNFTRGFEANFQVIWPFIGGGSPDGRARFNTFLKDREPGTLGDDDDGGKDLTLLPGMRVTLGNAAIPGEWGFEGNSVGAVHFDFVGSVTIHLDESGDAMGVTHNDASLTIRAEGILIKGINLEESFQKLVGSASSVARRARGNGRVPDVRGGPDATVRTEPDGASEGRRPDEDPGIDVVIGGSDADFAHRHGPLESGSGAPTSSGRETGTSSTTAGPGSGPSPSRVVGPQEDIDGQGGPGDLGEPRVPAAEERDGGSRASGSDSNVADSDSSGEGEVSGRGGGEAGTSLAGGSSDGGPGSSQIVGQDDDVDGQGGPGDPGEPTSVSAAESGDNGAGISEDGGPEPRGEAAVSGSGPSDEDSVSVSGQGSERTAAQKDGGKGGAGSTSDPSGSGPGPSASASAGDKDESGEDTTVRTSRGSPSDRSESEHVPVVPADGPRAGTRTPDPAPKHVAKRYSESKAEFLAAVFANPNISMAWIGNPFQGSRPDRVAVQFDFGGVAIGVLQRKRKHAAVTERGDEEHDFTKPPPGSDQTGLLQAARDAWHNTHAPVHTGGPLGIIGSDVDPTSTFGAITDQTGRHLHKVPFPGRNPAPAPGGGERGERPRGERPVVVGGTNAPFSLVAAIFTGASAGIHVGTTRKGAKSVKQGTNSFLPWKALLFEKEPPLPDLNLDLPYAAGEALKDGISRVQDLVSDLWTDDDVSQEHKQAVVDLVKSDGFRALLFERAWTGDFEIVLTEAVEDLDSATSLNAALNPSIPGPRESLPEFGQNEFPPAASIPTFDGGVPPTFIGFGLAPLKPLDETLSSVPFSSSTSGVPAVDFHALNPDVAADLEAKGYALNGGRYYSRWHTAGDVEGGRKLVQDVVDGLFSIRRVYSPEGRLLAERLLASPFIRTDGQGRTGSFMVDGKTVTLEFSGAFRRPRRNVALGILGAFERFSYSIDGGPSFSARVTPRVSIDFRLKVAGVTSLEQDRKLGAKVLALLDDIRSGRKPGNVQSVIRLLNSDGFRALGATGRALLIRLLESRSNTSEALFGSINR